MCVLLDLSCVSYCVQRRNEVQNRVHAFTPCTCPQTLVNMSAYLHTEPGASAASVICLAELTFPSIILENIMLQNLDFVTG